MTYRAPVRDLALSLQIAGHPALVSGAFAELDDDTVAAVLEAAGAFTEEQLAPLNRKGDQVGARYENGAVIAAPGFADAYQAFVAGGWNSLSADPEHGGQGLTKAMELAVFEMVHASNMAFGLCPMLTQGAIEALDLHGAERQKALVLPKLVSGEWTGTMNLTEPQAGSDLAAVTTRAEPDGNGGYRLYGQKIFITWGDHDAAENICHLVLARLPDSPPGVKGISLFLATKRLVDDEGNLGAANTLRAGSIEHKLGIHGSPTCVMLFEGAEAEMVSSEYNALPDPQKVREAVRELRDEGRREVFEAPVNARPWGTYETLGQADRYRIKRIVVEPGARLSLQYHHHRSEHWVVVRGTAMVSLDGSESLVYEGQSCYVPKGVPHRLSNPGKVPLEIIEVQNGEYVGEDDIVRMDDDYRREG